MQFNFFSIVPIADLEVGGQGKLMQIFYTIHDLLTPIIQVLLDKLMSDKKLEVFQHIQADDESVPCKGFFERKRRVLGIVGELRFDKGC